MKGKTKRLRLVWQFGKRYWPLFLLAEICILVSYTVSLLLPLNLTLLTDQVLYGGNHALLGQVIQNYLWLFLAAAAFNAVYAAVWQNLQNRYIVDIKNEMFRKTLFAQAGWLSSMNSGDIMSRIDTDSEQFLHVVQRNLFHFVNSLLLCGGILGIVWMQNRLVALMLIAAALLPIVITRLLGILTQRYAQKSRDITGRFTGRLFEILKGMRELRLLCARKWAEEQVLQPLKKLITLGNRLRRVDFALNKSVYFINLSASLVIYGVSAYLILKGEMTIGVFLAIIEYIALLHKKFNWMLRIYLDWFSRKVSIDRVADVLQAEQEPAIGLPLTGGIQSLCLNHVTFGYGNKPVLQDVCFHVDKGEHVAVAGVSGVGKTTLISLLQRLYEPQEGTVLVNGQDIRRYRLEDIRRRIGVLGQELVLFGGTVRENLLFGNEGCTDEDLLAVCAEVGLEDCIRRLPQGLDTPLGTDAADMSGGQKQRLMLARLLLRDVDVLILDEATSALDTQTEQAVMRVILRKGQGLAVLIISHRRETVLYCGRILVLENGRVAGDGSHEALRKSSSDYCALFGGAS